MIPTKLLTAHNPYLTLLEFQIPIQMPKPSKATSWSYTLYNIPRSPNNEWS